MEETFLHYQHRILQLKSFCQVHFLDLKFYINGEWVNSDSSELIDVINPANEEIIGQITAGTKEDINSAVDAASEAFISFSKSSKEERIDLLKNIIKEYENRYKDLAEIIKKVIGYKGKINFDSSLAGKIITLKYISDSLGTNDEMVVHKFAEEAMYKHIAYAILATRANTQEYLVMRFKKEKFAATRLAKLRLSNLKLEELTQIMRGKSKIIKH